jgi:hypothetical protein
VDIITALTLALPFDALLEETTEAGGTTCGPITLGAFHLGCAWSEDRPHGSCSVDGPRSLDGHISITNQFLPKGAPSGPLPIQSSKGQQADI